MWYCIYEGGIVYLHNFSENMSSGKNLELLMPMALIFPMTLAIDFWAGVEMTHTTDADTIAACTTVPELDTCS
jgi:hypothetical protein